MGENTVPLFKVDPPENKWEEEWLEMPEYNNINEPKPEIKAMFKFRNKDDFEIFNALMKKHIYKLGRVFDGNQKKNDYQAWFPLRKQSSHYEYIEEDKNND